MNPEQGLLKQILLWLWGRYHKSISNLPIELHEIHDFVSRSYPQFTDERELEALLSMDDPPRVDFDYRGKCLVLEPEPSQKIIPAITVMYDFRRSIPEVRFRLALFLLDDQDKPQALGFRFEAPEGEGIHHYYHAQSIMNFNGRPLKCPGWIPEKQPAFALDAQDCITLIICLLTSLYGLDFQRELQTSTFGNQVQKYIQNMYCKKFTPDYWELRIGGRKKYYKTWIEGKRFKLAMRTEFEASDIISITRKTYDAQKSNVKRVY